MPTTLHFNSLSIPKFTSEALRGWAKDVNLVMGNERVPASLRETIVVILNDWAECYLKDKGAWDEEFWIKKQ